MFPSKPEGVETPLTPHTNDDEARGSADELLSIGETSRRTGTAVSALRYYEDLGLIASVRTSGNHRLYARHMLRRISLISVAKNLGIPLKSVQDAFSTVPLDRAPTHKEWQVASRHWKRELEERRRGIERLENELTSCIGCGCLSLKACALLNPQDALGETGQGARRLS
ncbi:Redox-sensitive transcriptional activator SoxR, MerR-family [Corynebacterium glyciniphilum AJ 3170]|uniref:Redox-sensitive transcriptional activator SoxR, MerR-family n=1 Tax=Corynebacterium glyciniphilum AJ 3170 TaxID=1404245 RepID=X5DQV7_9CORY|nr:Redox-sensitive transcriptional activator SoxR, MerR-family [Corynebacterium glyciniphilum AJ 3170]